MENQEEQIINQASEDVQVGKAITEITVSEIPSILSDVYKLREISEVAFSNVDTDKSGFISVAELQGLMCNLADSLGIRHPTEEETKTAFGHTDLDGNDKISKEEFTKLVSELLSLMQILKK